ncbi:uncharacterized protein At4g15970-like [Phalaenopsis equestris]|uniref:uncharacterized protein At4g15970-like n=1 Tax=Phalaenopsis equestris TaxID=78828 RepID=UPI0009E5638A|nr:uncharacterized protein At4g15970-like [Phalaenopsis equestris]
MPKSCPLTTLHSLHIPMEVQSPAGGHVAPRSCLAILRCPPKPLIFLIAVFSVTIIFFSAAPILLNEGNANQWSGNAPVVVVAVDPVDSVDLENEEVRLARVLKEASMEDKTVLLTTLNAAWVSTYSIIDLFLESFQIGNGTRWLLDHLVIIAFDKKAYRQCMVIHSHCFALTTMGIDFSGEKNFMSDGYLKMMWRRIDFLRIVLEMGYNFIFTDADVMWFRNPFPHFFPDGDFQIACDRFFGDHLDRKNVPNGGFKFVKSNNRTIEFYKFWYSSRHKHPGYHDQDVLNRIKFDPFVDEIGLKMRFLSTAFFGGICEPSRNFSVVCTMHANCCVGLSRKFNDLRLMLEDWRRYMALPPALKNSRLPFWRIPQNCSLAPVRQQIL